MDQDFFDRLIDLINSIRQHHNVVVRSYLVATAILAGAELLGLSDEEVMAQIQVPT